MTPRAATWRVTLMPRSAAVLAIAAGGFALVAEGAAEAGDLAAYDPAITARSVALRTPGVTLLAQAATSVGSTVGIMALTVALVGFLVLRARDYRLAGLVVVTMLLSSAATTGLKIWFGRPRPPADLVVGPLASSFAFPSGHTLNSTVCFGLIAGVAMLYARTSARRALLAAGWLVASGMVGLSRIYLGYHWMTDVVGGFLVGVALLAAAHTAYLAMVRSPRRTEAPR